MEMEGNWSYDDAGETLQMATFGEIILNTTEYRAQELLSLTASPIIMGLGLLSNILSILVLRRLSNIKCTLGVYFLLSCYMNLIVIGVKYIPFWISRLAQMKYPVYYATDWTCKLWTLIDDLVTYPPQWLVAWMAVDLCIMIFHPDVVQQTSTRFLAKTKIVIIYTLLVFVDVYKTYTHMLTPHWDCVMAESFFKEPLFHVWHYASAIVNSYLPLIVVLIAVISNFIGMLLVEISESARSIELYCATMAQTTIFFLLTSPHIIMNFVTFTLPRQYMMDPTIADVEALHQDARIVG